MILSIFLVLCICVFARHGWVNAYCAYWGEDNGTHDDEWMAAGFYFALAVVAAWVLVRFHFYNGA